MTLGNGSTITIGDAEGRTFTLSGDGAEFVWVDAEGKPDTREWTPLQCSGSVTFTCRIKMFRLRLRRRGTPTQRRLTKLHRLQAARRAAKAKK